MKRSEGNYNLIVSNYGNDGHDIFFLSLSFQFVFALKLYSWPKIDLFYLLMARFFFFCFFYCLCAVCYHSDKALNTNDDSIYMLI